MPPRRSALRGFTLMEVLVALGLFTIGFVAVAAIFPTGAVLQQNSANDVLTRNLARNAKAIAQKLSLTYNTNGTGGGNGDLNEGSPALDSKFTVQALPYAGVSKPVLTSKWTEDLRSEPPLSPPDERDYCWVPLVQLTDTGATGAGDETPDSWRVFLFIMYRQPAKTYSAAVYPAVGEGRIDDKVPGLRSVRASRDPDARTFDTSPTTVNLRVNDYILAADGAIYRIDSISGTKLKVKGFINSNWGSTGTPADWVLWYAPPADGDSGSPCVKIVGPLTNGPDSQIVLETN